MSLARPKIIQAELALRADRIITMGCEVRGVPRIDEDWGLADPKDATPERVREIRDAVKSKARRLSEQMLG